MGWPVLQEEAFLRGSQRSTVHGGMGIGNWELGFFGEFSEWLEGGGGKGRKGDTAIEGCLLMGSDNLYDG